MVSLLGREERSDGVDFWRVSLGSEDVDLRTLAVEGVGSSTVACLGLSFEGVPGLDRFSNGADVLSSFLPSRKLFLDLGGEGRSLIFSLASELALLNFRPRNSAAFCRSVLLRSILTTTAFGFSDLRFSSSDFPARGFSTSELTCLETSRVDFLTLSFAAGFFSSPEPSSCGLSTLAFLTFGFSALGFSSRSSWSTVVSGGLGGVTPAGFCMPTPRPSPFSLSKSVGSGV